MILLLIKLAYGLIISASISVLCRALIAYIKDENKSYEGHAAGLLFLAAILFVSWALGETFWPFMVMVG